MTESTSCTMVCDSAMKGRETYFNNIEESQKYHSKGKNSDTKWYKIVYMFWFHSHEIVVSPVESCSKWAEIGCMENFQIPRNVFYRDRGLGKEFVLLQDKHSSGWVNSQAPDLPFLCWICQDYLDDRVFTFDIDFVSKCCSFTEACTHFLPDYFKPHLDGCWMSFSSLFGGFYIDLCLLVTYPGNHF